jgi:hypothetical protein
MQVVPPERALKWTQERLSEMSSYGRALAGVLNKDLPASWGPPGKPGNGRQIEEVCRRIADLAGNFLAWEKLVRFASLPPVLEEVGGMLPGCAGLVLDQLAKAYEDLSHVFAQERPSGTFKISFTPALPEGWNDRFQAALARASRALNS